MVDRADARSVTDGDLSAWTSFAALADPVRRSLLTRAGRGPAPGRRPRGRPRDLVPGGQQAPAAAGRGRPRARPSERGRERHYALRPRGAGARSTAYVDAAAARPARCRERARRPARPRSAATGRDRRARTADAARARGDRLSATRPAASRRRRRSACSSSTREFRAPIEDVWAAVTEPERLARWIGTFSGDPASGQVAFRMTAEEGAARTLEIRGRTPPRPAPGTSRSARSAGRRSTRPSVDGLTTLTLRPARDLDPVDGRERRARAGVLPRSPGGGRDQRRHRGPSTSTATTTRRCASTTGRR